VYQIAISDQPAGQLAGDIITMLGLHTG
jgi:hypothetical protein